MKKNFKKALLYGALSTLLLSGCSSKKNTKEVDYNSIKLEQDKENALKFTADDVINTNYKPNIELKGDDVVRIPDDYLIYVKCATNMDKEVFTVNDLSKILNLNIFVTDEDLSWVNYCTNLKNLTLNYIVNTDVTRYIDVLPSLSTCKIVSASNQYIEIDESKYKFLKKANSLSISRNVIIDEEYIANTDIKELSVVSGIESRIDYKKLTFLDNLKIDIDNEFPYNTAIYFTTEDMKYLNNNGVSIEVGDKVLEINKELDEINNSLSIDSLEIDINKYKTIATYVLNNMEYGDISKIKMYYDKGFLNAPLKYGEGVCGNYAALVEALCLRNNMDCYMIDSGNKGKHAWNIININGSYYYSDLTVFDDMYAIENITKEDIDLCIKYFGSYPFLFNVNYSSADMYDGSYYTKDYRKYMDENSIILKGPVYKKEK